MPVTIMPQYPLSPAQGQFPALSIEPGDWVLADEDGVVCVPKALEAQVVELAAKGRATDTLCMEDIIKGRGVAETFKDRRGNNK